MRSRSWGVVGMVVMACADPVPDGSGETDRDTDEPGAREPTVRAVEPATCASACETVEGTVLDVAPVLRDGGWGGLPDWPAPEGWVVIDDEAGRSAWVDRVPQLAALDPATQRGVVVWRSAPSSCGMSTEPVTWRERSDGSRAAVVVQVDDSVGCGDVCDAPASTLAVWILDGVAPVSVCAPLTGPCCATDTDTDTDVAVDD